jgi:hypothetical protein
MAIDSYIGFEPDPKPPAPKKSVVGTPEGDNEFAPDQPLTPVDGLQEPLGGETSGTATAEYKKD